jgi:hypothetical protein
MPLKTKKKHWKGSTTFGLFGLLTGTAAAGTTKAILDAIQPNNPDNIKWALAAGGATGILIGALAASGVLGVRVFSGRKEIVDI